MKLNSIYVTAKSFTRAKDWYQNILFQEKASKETDRFNFWKLGDVHFGVFNPDAIGVEVNFGDNCVPNFEVDDVDLLHNRLSNLGVRIVMDLNNVNGTRIFQCEDSEGNILEFYEWIE